MDGITISAADKLKEAGLAALKSSGRNFEIALDELLIRVTGSHVLLAELTKPVLRQKLVARIGDVAAKMRAERADKARQSGGGRSIIDTKGGCSSPAALSAQLSAKTVVAEAFWSTYRFRSGRLLADCTREALMIERDTAAKDIETEARTLKIVGWALTRIGDTGRLRDWVSPDEMADALKEAGHV